MEIFRKLNRILDRSTKIKFAILIVAIICGALLETATLAAISPLITILLDNSIVETNQYFKFFFDFFKFSNVNTFLAILTFVIASLYIFRGVYIFVLLRIQTRFTAKQRLKYSNQLLRKILSYPYLFHTGKNIAELNAIIMSDVNKMFNMIAAVLAFMTDSLMSFFMLTFLAITSPLITLGVLGVVLILVVAYFKVFRKEIQIVSEKQRNAGIGVQKSVFQALGGIKEVKLLRREAFFQKAFDKFSNISIKLNVRYTVLNAVPRLMIESICFGGAFIVIALFMLAGTDMSALIPQLSVFVLAAFRVLPAVTRAVSYANDVISSRVSVNAVYKNIFEEDEAITKAVLPEPAPPSGVREGNRDIVVNDVSFIYPNTEMPVLESVSLTIPEMKSVAFVGPSGAGKTTLADIILGVLGPQSGGVFYSGKSIHHNFKWWCGNVGYIPQVIYLLDESVLENVAFGIDRSEIDIDRVWHALEQAQLADFVRTLPKGIETTIGERGIRLSGGQRQRIGIARALYENPPILVLDEATSSLDNETEKAVMESIEKFQGEKTMLIIAHRLTTIENCDIIYRIEDGKAYRER